MESCFIYWDHSDISSRSSALRRSEAKGRGLDTACSFNSIVS